MSTTSQFFDELGHRAGTPDRPFVDANEIASELGMNDTDLIAAIEDVERDGMIDVCLTEQGMEIWKQQHG